MRTFENSKVWCTCIVFLWLLYSCSISKSNHLIIIRPMDGESAPAPAADAETITLRVKDQSAEEMFFKVKKSTKMSKVHYARILLFIYEL